MKTLIRHRKITLSIFVMIMLLCGLGGVSYAQVCKVGDVLFPGQGCSDPSVGYFSVLADGSASIGGATLNAANIHWNAFSAKNLGNAWEITAVTGGAPPEPTGPEVLVVDPDAPPIYWTNYDTEKIQRANLDGSDVQDLVTQGLGGPFGIALDVVGGKMYWTDIYTDKIQRANLDGSNIEDLVTRTQGLSGPNGIALDVVGGKMYWTDSRAEKIQRANLDGSNIEDLVTQGLEWTGDIALDVVGGKMYWVDYHTKKIQRANLDGSNIEDLVTQGLSGPNGIALDVEGGKMYWTDSSRAEKIQRANLDGSNIEDLVTSVSGYGIVLDVAGGKMYWTNEGAYKIQRANLDGSNVEDLVIELREPGGIALAIPATQQPAPQPDLADVNGDGTVNILDLVSIASSFGQTGETAADINGDGAVNIQDLVLAAGAIGNDAAAPLLHTESIGPLTSAEVKQWLSQAQQLALADLTSQRGIQFLEQLLASMVPKETLLLANYPNPFNPETWIPYQLSKPAAVMITIYASNGHIIRQLSLGHQPAGVYQSRSRAAYWDGRNAVGEPVASGVYFYTLTAGDFSATRKMLIRK